MLANTVQQKEFDGRIPSSSKEWAKSVEVCPENATQFIVDKVNPGLTDLFLRQFQSMEQELGQQRGASCSLRDAEVRAWERDEIVSIEKTVVDVSSPVTEKKTARQEKPSIREKLKAAAKSQPERKSLAKQKSHEAELE